MGRMGRSRTLAGTRRRFAGPVRGPLPSGDAVPLRFRRGVTRPPFRGSGVRLASINPRGGYSLRKKDATQVKFSVGLRNPGMERANEPMTSASVTPIARAAERAGFYAVNVIDHPIPDDHWLHHGGHRNP